MTFEEMQRTMEFLLQHGAQLDARLERTATEMRAEVREADAKLRESDERLRESQATLTAAVLRIADLVEDLTEAQKGTDNRLNALINVVEKYITGTDGGRKKKS